jgi:hypothetical protein
MLVSIKKGIALGLSIDEGYKEIMLVPPAMLLEGGESDGGDE